MENIKIENTWESADIPKECGCCWKDTRCNPIKTECAHHCNQQDLRIDLLESMSCGSRLFTNNLYAIKYPNLIITNTADTQSRTDDRNSHLHIFDINQNKVVFSSKNNLSEENQKLVERLQLLDCYRTNTYRDAKFRYNSTMMMENFMVMRFKSNDSHSKGTCYIIFNFKTHKYKSFIFCDLYIYNDRSVFVFVGYDIKYEITKVEIITKSDIVNNIYNIMKIDFNKCGVYCMCNSSIIIFTQYKLVADKYLSKCVYYDIKKQKNVYTSVNKFIGWRGHKFIEYNEELKKCNLVSIISDDIQQFLVKNNIPKKIINCDRCLDKFEESAEEVNQDHKNICSLCKKN